MPTLVIPAGSTLLATGFVLLAAALALAFAYGVWLAFSRTSRRTSGSLMRRGCGCRW